MSQLEAPTLPQLDDQTPNSQAVQEAARGITPADVVHVRQPSRNFNQHDLQYWFSIPIHETEAMFRKNRFWNQATYRGNGAIEVPNATVLRWLAGEIEGHAVRYAISNEAAEMYGKMKRIRDERERLANPPKSELDKAIERRLEREKQEAAAKQAEKLEHDQKCISRYNQLIVKFESLNEAEADELLQLLSDCQAIGIELDSPNRDEKLAADARIVSRFNESLAAAKRFPKAKAAWEKANTEYVKKEAELAKQLQPLAKARHETGELLRECERAAGQAREFAQSRGVLFEPAETDDELPALIS